MAAPLKKNVKEKILIATIRLLQESSFEELTLAKIAKETDISKGTLYYHYNSKDKILFDVTEYYLLKLADDLTSWADNKEKDTLPPRLLKYILERGTGMELSNLRLYIIGSAVSDNVALRQRYIELHKSFRQVISQKIKERMPTVDAEYITWLVLTAMDGILVQQRLKNKEFDSAEFIEKTVKFICNSEKLNR